MEKSGEKLSKQAGEISGVSAEGDARLSPEPPSAGLGPPQPRLLSEAAGFQAAFSVGGAWDSSGRDAHLFLYVWFYQGCSLFIE